MNTYEKNELTVRSSAAEFLIIVGDLEPVEYLGAYEENVKLKADWELVMSYNPKLIYYAHANEKCNSFLGEADEV